MRANTAGGEGAATPDAVAYGWSVTGTVSIGTLSGLLTRLLSHPLASAEVGSALNILTNLSVPAVGVSGGREILANARTKEVAEYSFTTNNGGFAASLLDTALGTMVRFTRGGVAYTVIGSVPSAAADAAARGL